MKTMIKPPLPQWILDRYPNTPEDQIRASLDAFVKGVEPPKTAKHELEVSNLWWAQNLDLVNECLKAFIENARLEGYVTFRTESLLDGKVTNFIME